MKDSRINILFLITFSTFFGNFNDINWFYWLQYIATLLDQELLDYLQQIIQGIPITILFMPSLVTFNGLFCNMSLVIYPFWIACPVVKSFNTTDLFFSLYTTYTHYPALCLSNRNSLSFTHLDEIQWHFSTLSGFHEFQ